MAFVVALNSKRVPTILQHPTATYNGRCRLLLVSVILSLSLLVSADPSPATPVGSPPYAGNESRQARRHRGFSIHASSSILNRSGAGVMQVRRTNQFLDAQNAVRDSVGEPHLLWDHNLAKYARNWANGRVSDCKMIHSGGPYGENIFWGSKDRWTPAQIVNMWVDEVQYYDPVHNSCRDGEICGHYTQVVWRDSTKVGCARVSCNNGGMYAICVYDPPGNYIGENPFANNMW